MAITIVTPDSSVWASFAAREVTIVGEYTGAPRTIQRQVDGGAWVTAVATPTGGEFVDRFSLPLGEHTVQYRNSADVGEVSATVTQVVCPVFADGAAQSNKSGRLTNLQALVPAPGGATAYLFDNNDTWRELSDPYDDNTGVDAVGFDANVAGSWTVLFANLWLADKGTPVAFVAGAKGGTTVAKWQRDSGDRVDGLNLYGSVARRMPKVNGVSAFIAQIGETDAFLNTEAEDYKAGLAQIVDDFYSDFGAETLLVPLHTIQDSEYDGVSATTGQAAIRAAQVELAATHPRLTIAPPTSGISLDPVTGDGIHFKDTADGEALAAIAYDFMKDYTPEVRPMTSNRFSANGSSGFSAEPVPDILGAASLHIEGYVQWDGSAGYLYAQSPASGLREFALLIFSSTLYIRIGGALTNLGGTAEEVVPGISAGGYMETDIDLVGATVQFTLDGVAGDKISFTAGAEALAGVRFTFGGRTATDTPGDTDMSGFVPVGTVFGNQRVILTRLDGTTHDVAYIMPDSGASIPEVNGGPAAVVVGGTGGSSDFIQYASPARPVPGSMVTGV